MPESTEKRMEEPMDKKKLERYERQQRIYRYMSREAARNSIYLKREKEKKQENSGRITHNAAMYAGSTGNSTGSIVGTFSGRNAASNNGAGMKKNKMRKTLLPIVLFALIFLIIIMVKVSYG